MKLKFSMQAFYYITNLFTVYCFCLAVKSFVKKFCCFHESLCHCKTFSVIILSRVSKIGSVTGNHKSFPGFASNRKIFHHEAKAMYGI